MKLDAMRGQARTQAEGASWDSVFGAVYRAYEVALHPDVSVRARQAMKVREQFKMISMQAATRTIRSLITVIAFIALISAPLMHTRCALLRIWARCPDRLYPLPLLLTRWSTILCA